MVRFLAVVFSFLVPVVSGHGWITDPISRIELVANYHVGGMPDGTLRYCPSCSAGPNSCGSDNATYLASLKDVWQKFYDDAGVTIPHFAPGQSITFNQRITADHGGQAWMMVSCSDHFAENIPWHLLERTRKDSNFMSSNPGVYAWAMGESAGHLAPEYTLPGDFSCPDGHAIGRWLWKTSHQCNDVNNIGRYTARFNIDEFAAVVHAHSPGVSILSPCQIPPETFIGCFDFTTASGPAPPAPSPTPAPTPAPACTEWKAISPVVSDQWCKNNCMHTASPDCPPTMCKCADDFTV